MIGVRPSTGLFDWAFEGALNGIGEMISQAILGFVISLAKLTRDMLFSAFTTEQVTESTWQVVRGSGSTGFVHMWIMIMAPVLVAIVCIQAAVSMLRRNKAGIIRAGVGAVFGIPLSLFAVWMIEKLLKAMDETTVFITNAVGKTPEEAFMRVFGFIPSDKGPEGLGYEMDMTHWMWWTGSAGAPLFIGLVIFLLVAIAALVLNAMMIFRGFALAVAASLAPVVIMMMPLEASKSWFTKWAELITGLLLAKPLAFAVLVFSMSLFNESVSVNDTLMGLVGMIIASMMPLIAMKFISFTPASSTTDMDGAAKGAAQAPGRVASSMLRMRSLGRK